MSWLWPRHLNGNETALVRTVRVVHWIAVGFAVFGFTITIVSLVLSGETYPIAYITIVFMWFAVALLGRAFRYVLARE
jgi:hypothetical protein